MAIITVGKYIDEAQESETIRRAQAEEAGLIVAQFLLIREGLDRRSVRSDPATLDTAAATLTAAVWRNKQNAEPAGN